MGIIGKFIKFCTVGLSGVLVDFSVTYLLKERLRMNRYAANAAGFITAATSNYILNRIWTFSSTDPDIAGQYARFVIISAVGLLINTAIIWLLNGRLRIQFHRILRLDALMSEEAAPKADFYISKLIAIGVVTVWNFLTNYYLNFRV